MSFTPGGAAPPIITTPISIDDYFPTVENHLLLPALRFLVSAADRDNCSFMLRMDRTSFNTCNLQLESVDLKAVDLFFQFTVVLNAQGVTTLLQPWEVHPHDIHKVVVECVAPCEINEWAEFGYSPRTKFIFERYYDDLMGYKLRKVLVDVPPIVDTPPTENEFGSYPGLPTSLCSFLSALVVPDAQFTLTGHRGDSIPTGVFGLTRYAYTLVLQSSSLVVMGRTLTKGLSALNKDQVYTTSIEFDVQTNTDVVRHVVECSSIIATLNCQFPSPQIPFSVSFPIDGSRPAASTGGVALPKGVDYSPIPSPLHPFIAFLISKRYSFMLQMKPDPRTDNTSSGSLALSYYHLTLHSQYLPLFGTVISSGIPLLAESGISVDEFRSRNVSCLFGNIDLMTLTCVARHDNLKGFFISCSGGEDADIQIHTVPPFPLQAREEFEREFVGIESPPVVIPPPYYPSLEVPV